MSGSNEIDWLHFYQEGSSSFPTPPAVSEATTVTTQTQTQTQLMSPAEGRVSKPIRRRSRASRRTPTTLLNTDTTNFRAMVQQFTGGPTAPFAQAVGLGFASRPPPGQLSVNPNGLMFQQQQQQQQYNSMLGGNSREREAVPENTFFQRLSNPTPPTNVNDELTGGLFMDHGAGRFFPST